MAQLSDNYSGDKIIHIFTFTPPELLIYLK